MSETPHERTDNPVVDEVVESLEQVEGAPVSERVKAFEEAQEKLRNALADAGEGTGEGTGDDPAGS